MNPVPTADAGGGDDHFGLGDVAVAEQAKALAAAGLAGLEGAEGVPTLH